MEHEVKHDSCGVCVYPTRYPHICRGDKARNAANLIIEAWQGANGAGMSKRQTMHVTGLNDDWFDAGKAYIRIHASAMFAGVDRMPYVHESRESVTYDAGACTWDKCKRADRRHRHYEGGVYKLTLDDEVVAAYLMREWSMIAEMLQRRAYMTLAPMERLYNGTSLGRKALGMARRGINRAVEDLREAASTLQEVDASVRQDLTIDSDAELVNSTP